MSVFCPKGLPTNFSSMKIGTLSILLLPLYLVVSTASCVKDVEEVIDIVKDPECNPDTTTIVYYRPADDPKQPEPTPVDLEGKMTVTPYADLGYKHQSAAVYGNYAFFVRDGRSGIRLQDLAAKRRIYTYSMKGENIKIYHCNQSTFGTEKYEPEDYFPLLYISQRVVRENRCMTEVYRIIPLFNADSTALLAFRTELVQEIFFPPMSRENSMGNVNCVIDPVTGKMYTYSRNNAAQDDNYQRCKISRFSVPDIYQRTVVLEDADIESSFLIDTKAVNMQGGCIVDGRLYIGQGYPPLEIFLNVVDLQEEKLVRRYNLVNRGVNWEPEGCFFYDGNVMLAYTAGISRIIEEE